MFVDPTIGTGGGGWGQPQVFVGASLPFGMAKVGPDTSDDFSRELMGFAHTSGYWFNDRYIDGFSHLHLHGTGIEDLGTLLLMPTAGMSPQKTQEDGYRQAYRHDDETAAAGLYQVTLEDGIAVALTASQNAGAQRHTFPDDTEDPVLIIDVSHGIGRNGTTDAEVTADLATGLIEGRLRSAGRFTGTDRAFDIFFSLRLTPPPRAVGTWDEFGLHDDETSAAGADIGLYAHLAEPVQRTDVGLSLIDLDQARQNRGQTEGRTIDDIAAAARDAWRPLLDVAHLGATEDPTARTIFTTALYHALLCPTDYAEGGRYRGLDRAVHDGDTFYSELSMWDTYRTAHPLYAWLFPERAADMAGSILTMAAQHGGLPRWPLAINETGTMLGSPASIILADTWLRGADTFDTDQALAVMLDDAESGRGAGYAACRAEGFCPREQMGRPVAHAAEWGWADFAIGQVLAHLDDDRADDFRQRARLVRGHFDPVAGFFRGRNLDGSFDRPDDDGFDPTKMDEDYAEGAAWHYLYAAPYDLPGLVEGLGGRDAFLATTRSFFDQAMATPPRYLIDEIRQPDPYYWHGNEPDLHAVFTLSMAGAPADTAKYLAWIRATKYDASPWGLDGNDDAGTLSAWYVLSALGLFPLPGSDLWILVPPLFHQVTLPSGLTISTTGTGDYITGVTLDGAAHDRAWLTHAELADATTLVFALGAAPTGWGQADPLLERLAGE